jgi:8-oxo-dGTP pyrophosphatase MutT (NUDIX family)
MAQHNEPVLQVAAKAILVNPKGKILILREAGETYEEGTNAGKYHAAAGGRIHPDETYLDGLRREVAEETGIRDLSPLYPIYVGEWWPVIKGSKHHIVAIFTICKTNDSKVRLSNEHDKFHWIFPEECRNFDILPAELDAVNAYLNHQIISKV